MSSQYDDEYTFTHGGETRPVYVVGLGAKGVLLMHELPGLSPEAIDLARFLAEADMTVHMPLLFGKVGQRSVAKGMLPGLFQMMCIRREFAAFAADHESPITEWLRGLARHISQRHGSQIGAIGMCLSGGWVLPVIVDTSVAAGVAAQPSVPFRFKGKEEGVASLGAAAETIDDALSTGKPLLAQHFQTDGFCRPERFAALRDAFLGATPPDEAPAPVLREFQGKGHATLTIDHADATKAWTVEAPAEWDRSQDPTGPSAREAVRDFLLANLSDG